MSPSRAPDLRRSGLTLTPSTSSRVEKADTTVSSATKPEFGPNDWFVEEKYNQFLADPSSVEQIWRDFFTDPVDEARRAPANNNGGNGHSAPSPAQGAPSATATTSGAPRPGAPAPAAHSS